MHENKSPIYKDKKKLTLAKDLIWTNGKNERNYVYGTKNPPRLTLRPSKWKANKNKILCMDIFAIYVQARE